MHILCTRWEPSLDLNDPNISKRVCNSMQAAKLYASCLMLRTPEFARCFFLWNFLNGFLLLLLLRAEAENGTDEMDWIDIFYCPFVDI